MTSDDMKETGGDETCWFCEERPSGGMHADHVVWLRAPADYQGGSRTTVWDERGIPVARCQTCGHRHAALVKTTKLAWVLAALIFVTYLFLNDKWHVSENTIYFAFALCVAAIGARMLFGAGQRLLGTRPESSAKTHHQVRELLDRGARLGRAQKN